MQDARKGVLFDAFPPVLQLQLKRFEYDFRRDLMVKVREPPSNKRCQLRGPCSSGPCTMNLAVGCSVKSLWRSSLCVHCPA